MSLKIVTWNINSVNVRLAHLISLIDDHKPDIICLQELKCENHKFPENELSDFYYNLYVNGQKSYNGVAILSKLVVDNVITDFPDNPIPEQSRYIEISLKTEVGYCRVISLYAPNGGEVGSDKFKIKLDFYDAFTNYLESIRSFDERIIICSDYNIAPFDIDVYDPDKLRHSTCFTIEEKRKLRKILNSGFVDNYRLLHPGSHDFTWWDYRAGAFEQNKGYRIDSILSSSNLTNNIKDCSIDYKTREKAGASDHAPVIAIYEG
jgi:exodeoxyribonuclease-3